MASQSQYDNTNRGALFRNQRKTSDKHPDYTGTLDVDGEEFWISAWSKVGQKGSFLSISITSKEETKKAAAAAREDDMLAPTPVGRAVEREHIPAKSGTPARGLGDLDDDIPF